MNKTFKLGPLVIEAKTASDGSWMVTSAAGYQHELLASVAMVSPLPVTGYADLGPVLAVIIGPFSLTVGRIKT